MSIPWKRGLGTFIIWLLFHAEAWATDKKIAKSLNLFSGEYLFNKLDLFLIDIEIWTASLAFLVLCAAGLYKFYSGAVEREPLKVALCFAVAIVAMMGSTRIIEVVKNAADDFADTLEWDSSVSIADHMYQIVQTMDFSEQELRAHQARKQEQAETQINGQNGGNDAISIFGIGKLLSSMKTDFARWQMRFWASFWMFLINVVLTACAYAMIIYETVRYFFIAISKPILPLLIAGLLLPTVKQVSMNYLRNFLALILWPVGWGLGHIGTKGLFVAASNIIPVEAISDEKAAAAAEAMREAVASGVFQSTSAESMQRLQEMQAGSLWGFIVIMILIGFWSFYVTIKTPGLMHSVVSGAGSYFEGIMGATAATSTAAAVATVGPTAKIATVFGSRAAMSAIRLGGKSSVVEAGLTGAQAAVGMANAAGSALGPRYTAGEGGYDENGQRTLRATWERMQQNTANAYAQHRHMQGPTAEAIRAQAQAKYGDPSGRKSI